LKAWGEEIDECVLAMVEAEEKAEKEGESK
jgi:hypothetical protein